MRLANGQGWHLIATEEVVAWVEKLAFIMELKQCAPNGYPKLIFVLGQTDPKNRGQSISGLDPNIQENLPKSGWKERKFPAIKIWNHHSVPDMICEVGHEKVYELDILRMYMALYPVFEMVQYSGGLPLHAALVERDGMGMLLSASGDTGKSTCCGRLRSPWKPLCDDETLVVRDDQKQYLAHPFPTWSEHLWRRSTQTWNVERHVSLSAIFFLEQAEADRVVSIGSGEATVLINHSAMQICHQYWHKLKSEEIRNLRKKLFENACELARSIPAFKLRVSLEGCFWEEMEKVLS